MCVCVCVCVCVMKQHQKLIPIIIFNAMPGLQKTKDDRHSIRT